MQDEPSWEDLKRIKEKREAEAKDPTKIKPITKKKIPPKRHNFNPSRETLMRLWALRNKDYFEVKELKILPNDKIENIYHQVHNWHQNKYLEKIWDGYCVTKEMKAKLEETFSFMKEFQHGKGI